MSDASRRWVRKRARPVRRAGLRAGDLVLACVILGVLALLATKLDGSSVIVRQGVARIHDGDTLTVGGARIRLVGLDAPEIGQSCESEGASYRCGTAAREALERLAAGDRVRCEGNRTDRYGRLLARCSTQAQSDLGASLVRDGWAVSSGDYALFENEARDAARGIWAGEFDRPRDWRAKHGELADEGSFALSFLDRLGLLTGLW